MSDSIADVARRHGFSEAAARTLADAIRRGGGRMAQFSHPELGGLGQWSRGGMLMIGAMDHNLKARVAALADALAGASVAAADCAPAATVRDSPEWWPAALGHPTASGSQNGVRYAVFPAARRVALERDGAVSVRDSGERRITGVSQQQGVVGTLVFSSPEGAIDADVLPVVGG